ncbi:Hypp5290 [Branchiostoma lanceolatum]|uniref:Hypp5290 protein n=1 Tax=Branchiostoma lanceolatum TaxID=7740 RepID=A0A8K0AF84_BRALA|nr:Hypp5290 [Branchiostoma lanceolatum]
MGNSLTTDLSTTCQNIWVEGVQVNEEDQLYFSDSEEEAEFYMEKPHHHNNRIAAENIRKVEGVQVNEEDQLYFSDSEEEAEFYMEKPHRHNNRIAAENIRKVEGVQVNEEDQLYFSDSEEEAEFYMEKPRCHDNHITAENIRKNKEIQRAEDDLLYLADSEDEELGHNKTTVFPLTLQWVHKFRASVDDDCGPDLILGKFLTSLLNNKFTACNMKPYSLDDRDIEGRVYLSRSEAGTIYESDGDWTDEETGHSKCQSETSSVNKLAACDVANLEKPRLFDALDIEGRVHLSRSEAGTIYESDGDWTTDEETGYSKCETPYNDLAAFDMTMVTEPHLFDALDIEGRVYLSRGEVGTIYESDGEEWTTDEGHSDCESETPYNKLTACDVTAVKETHLFDALDIEGKVYLSRGEVRSIYESDGEEWTTDEGHSKCESETPYNELAAFDMTMVTEPHLFDALDIEGRVYLSRSEVGSIYESDGEEWTTDEGHSKCESETLYNKLVTACDVTAVQEPYLFDALDIEGGVYLSRRESEVGTIYESDGEEWTTDEGQSKCESEMPYNKITACDVTTVTEPHLFDALDIEGKVYLSRDEVGTIYESDGEELTTDEGHSKCESETLYNKLTAFDMTMVMEPHLFDALDIEGRVYLSRSEVGSIYESDGEEWTTDEETGHSPDGDITEERLAVLTSAVPDVRSDCATEKGAQIPDHFEMDQQTDFATEMIQLLNSFEMDQQSVFTTEEMIQLLDHFEMDQQSVFATEEMIQLLDPFEMDQQSDYGAEEMIQLLDPMGPTEHSDTGTEEEFHLLDPVEVPMLHVWQEVALEPEATTTKRLSRYELHYGPTHRVQSPSCPMIGVRGDNRSLVNSADVEHEKK